MRFIIGILLAFCVVTVQAKELKDLREFGEVSTNTIYLFSSPSCPHCRDFHKIIFPELLKRYVKTKRAQVLIVDMVYDEAAMQAAMLMRCLPEAKAHKMMNWLYENQAQWTKLKDTKNFFLQYSLPLGMTINEFNACLDDGSLRGAIEQQRDSLSNLYQVRGWPTIVLRQGNTVKQYVGVDKHAVLHGLETDIKAFEQKQKQQR